MSVVLTFPWETFIKYTSIITIIIWAGFFFYDYFILESKNKDDIYDNPINKKSSEADTRQQVFTDKVEFDGMLNTK
jgi:hypothetical protein